MTDTEATRAAIIDEITHAFDGISREDGITLHEAAVINDYGTDGERAEARTLDTETRWQDMPASDIERYQPLNFLDVQGFRYYLPAYMIWTLRYHETAKSISVAHTISSLTLTKPSKWLFRRTLGELHRNDVERFASLSQAQCQAVCQFLRFMARYDEEQRQHALKALDRYWSQFCSPSSAPEPPLDVEKQD